MKAISIVLIIWTLYVMPSSAQTIFAPEGATWVYLNGADYSSANKQIHKVIGDTVFKGVNSKMVAKSDYYGIDGTMFPLGYDYYYTSGDTIFKYSEFYDRYIVHLRFDVAVGDTLYYPIPDFVYADSYPVPEDSMYVVIVDSLKKVTLNTGDTVRMVYTHPWKRFGNLWDLDQMVNYYFHHSAWDDGLGVGYYAERLGLRQFEISQLYRAVPAVEYSKDLICYSENDVLEYRRLGVVATCDTVLGILKFEKPLPIAIYPNPSSSILYFNLSENTSIISSQIFAIDGRKFEVKYLSNNQIDIQDLSNGVYYLQITDKEGNRFTGNFVKQ